MNLAEHLVRVGHRFPNGTAIAHGIGTWASWSTLCNRVSRIANALHERQRLAAGDRVILLMHNCPQYVELLYACWYGGFVAVPTNSKLHPKEISYIVENSDAALVFITDDISTTISDAQNILSKDLQVIDVNSSDYKRLLEVDPRPMTILPADAPAWLFYTSGTTGKPKGAILTHDNLHHMALSYFVSIDPLHVGSLLHAAPMSHGSGQYIVPHIMVGNTQIVPESGHFDPAEVLQLTTHWPEVSAFLPPTLINRLNNYRNDSQAPENFRCIIYGGSPMYLTDLKSAIRNFGFKFAQLYGQGETPMTITGMTRRMIEDAYLAGQDHLLSSAGVPHSVVEVKVVDKDDRDLPAMEIGEIVVRGPTVMSGYWRNAEASAAALRGGWLHTGDLGSYDPNGYLTVTDRSKDLIITGGANVYPREVEEVLLLHPAVKECAVVGVSDPEWGERVVAFVVSRSITKIDEHELDNLCLNNIARFKRPKEYRFVDDLPKNNYGKILKRELRDLATQRP